MFKSKNSMSRALVRRETTAGYLFLLPSLFFFVTFVLYPMFLCIYTSFFDSNMGKNAVDVFVGLGNYKELFQDKLFLGALKNTVIIVLVAVPTVCAFSLWVATAIYDMKPALTSAFRCIFYLPVVTGSVAVTVVWKWMYNNRFGVFNYLFKSLGIIDQNINWLGDARFALWCIILILFTTSVGQPIVLYVSALGNVDHSLVEAAQVDGANLWQRICYITIPLLKPTIIILFLLSIGKIMSGDLTMMMSITNLSPMLLDTTDIIDTYVYRSVIGVGDFVMGSAVGLYQSIFGFILVLFSNWLVGRFDKDYQLF